mmetsp:Transcript_23988/g.43904  ORF Transcript_23988/g.43904 Transcript_23988/m.43904 type:complete len:505 (+) Transcript_23988:8391-9905(+)
MAIKMPRFVGGRVPRGTAVFAQSAQQPLRDDPAQRGGDQKVIKPQIAQPHHSAHRSVGVQRGKHQVPGQCGLCRDAGGLTIPDLSHQDDIRVLPQRGAQPVGKGHANLGVDLRLADALQVILNRVLDRDDVALVPVGQLQQGIERRGFARPRGAGGKDDPVGQRRQPFQQRDLCRAQAQVGQWQQPRRPVKDPQHDPLTIVAGQRTDPGVDGTPAKAKRDAAVLGQARFGDVQPRHHLEPGHHTPCRHVRAVHDLLQKSVDPHARPQPVFVGFDMQVRRAGRHRTAQQLVDQLDHGCIAFGLQKVALTRGNAVAFSKVKGHPVAFFGRAAIIDTGQCGIKAPRVQFLHVQGGDTISGSPPLRLAQAQIRGVRTDDQRRTIKDHTRIARQGKRKRRVTHRQIGGGWVGVESFGFAQHRPHIPHQRVGSGRPRQKATSPAAFAGIVRHLAAEWQGWLCGPCGSRPCSGDALQRQNPPRAGATAPATHAGSHPCACRGTDHPQSATG